MKTIINTLIKKGAFVNLITVALIIIGCLSIFDMKRQAFPDVNFDVVSVNTLYPGASTLEVEKLVTTELEREIKSIDGIKNVQSTSSESRSYIAITIDPDFKNKRKVVNDIKDTIDRVKPNFPNDVEDPELIEFTTKQSPVIEIALFFKEKQEKPIKDTYQQKTQQGKNIKSVKIIKKEIDLEYNTKNSIKKTITPKSKKLNQTFSEERLREEADVLQKSIESLSEVAFVRKRGYRDKEIHIEIDPKKLAKYNLSGEEIINAIRNRNVNYPSGVIESKGQDYLIRTVKEYANLEEIYNTFIRTSDFGGAIRVKDVAFVQNDFKEKLIKEKVYGEEAIVLTVLKKSGSDIINTVDAIKEKIKDFQKVAPKEVSIDLENDVSFYVKRRLNVLVNNITVGMISVLIVLFLFIGWRIALMVVIGIPIAFALTFIIMNIFGVTINLLSMFAMVIVCGMIVDDAIIVGENISKKLEEGLPIFEAVSTGAQEMLKPVFAAISTTIVAFSPLLFMSGIMGKFIWVMPAVVIIALISSLLESFLILPSHIYEIVKPKKTKKKKSLQNNHIIKEKSLTDSKVQIKIMGFIEKLYSPIIRKCINHKYISLIVVIGFLFLGFALMRPLGFILFPKGGVEIIFTKLESKKGISLDGMDTKIAPVENAIRNLDDGILDSYQTRIGIQQESEMDATFLKRGKHYAQLNIYLTPANSRDVTAEEVVHYLKTKTNETKKILYSDYQQSDNNTNSIVYASSDNTISFREIKKNKILAEKKIPVSNDFIYGGGFLSNTSKEFVYYSSYHKLQKYNIENGKSTAIKEIAKNKTEEAYVFYVLPNSYIGLLIMDTGIIYSINLRNGAKKPISTLAYSPIVDFEILPNKQSFAIINQFKQLLLYSYSKKSIKLEKKINVEKYQDHGKINDISYFNSNLENSNRKFIISYSSGWVNMINVDSKKLEYSLKLDWLQKNEMLFSTHLLSETAETYIISTNLGLYTYNAKAKTVVSHFSTFASLTNIIHTPEHYILFSTYKGMYYIQKSNPTLQIRELQKPQKLLEKIEFKQASSGPPVGSPIFIEITGENFDTLSQLSGIIKNKLNSIEHVYDVRDSWEDGSQEIHLIVNEQKAALAKVSIAQIASSLQMAFSGQVVSSIKRIDEEVDIRVQFLKDYRKNLNSLKEVYVRNTLGNLVPIVEIASFQSKVGLSSIVHYNNDRTVVVLANLDERKTSSLKVNQIILKDVKDILINYPGYNIKPGGEYEDTQESLSTLGKSFFFALIGILLILVFLFGNFRNSIIILCTIPLGTVGVIFAFYLHKILFLPNLTFSFLAFMGFIGLTGVVVNDSIILVDYINKLVKQGTNIKDAVINGAIRRLKPVTITTVTTLVGILPVAYGIGGADPFLKPMALALGWGLFFSTPVTLIVTPLLYYLFSRKKDAIPEEI